VFIATGGGNAALQNGQMPHDYLQQFADEVALAQTQRAQEYLKVWVTGQRYLWTFSEESVALLSLVVLLPEGPRSVMCVSTKDELCDLFGNLQHHMELCIRWGIEASVGTTERKEPGSEPAHTKTSGRHSDQGPGQVLKRQPNRKAVH
jgi:hypothetical protein